MDWAWQLLLFVIIAWNARMAWAHLRSNRSRRDAHDEIAHGEQPRLPDEFWHTHAGVNSK